jgi:phenylpropionate dioxygenase-like ring-hydroxylating dioxygenase large terminal subunit
VTPLPPTVARTWLPVALSREVAARPLARRLAGTPIVLVRMDGAVRAFVDRCPHRNYPLSQGRLNDGLLECPYHGWRFGPDGATRQVPGQGPNDAVPGHIACQALAVAERHGAVFVRLDREGPAEPWLPPLLGDPGHDHFWWGHASWRGRAIDAVENVLDPYHTSFIHHGIIRDRDRRQKVELTLHLHEDGLDASYAQDRPDPAWMSRALEPPRSRSAGRYYPPVTVQARWYGKDDSLSLAVSAFFTPEGPDSFRPFACFTTPKGRGPGWLKEQAIRLFLRPVIRQDREALARQYEVIEAFGGPRFHQGPLDRVSTAVARLYAGQTLEPGTEGPWEVWL